MADGILAEEPTPPSSNNSGNKLARLPACRFCYSRKTKCDNVRPRCTFCVKHNEECVTLAVDDNEPIDRRYIGDLELEIERLENAVASESKGIANDSSLGENINQELLNGQSISPAAESTPNQDHHSKQVAHGGGISFMRHLFTDSGWREHDPSLLQNLSKASGPVEAGVSPNQLPSAQDARGIFDKFLNGSHIQNPFLLRSDIEQVYREIFASPNPPELRPAENGEFHRSLFRAFMILAIGSVLSYRNGVFKHHPFGYYLSAMKLLGDNFLSDGIRSIQDLLLIGRFAIYYHIGTSIWEITRLSMRLCIEQGFHKPPLPNMSTTLLEEQIQRRVFWQCYMIDRYSSITLERPFSIAERSIKVNFPADADDVDIEAAGNPRAFLDLDSFSAASVLATSTTNTPTETTVFITCVRLRQITSRIHLQFNEKAVSSDTKDHLFARGAIYTKLDELLADLYNWRCSAPVFQEPKCLYQMKEWYDHLYLREKLLLVRKAIDIVPKRNSLPPRDLLVLCLQSAVGAITVYCLLYENRSITYTRSYFQTLFTAGLSIMYCLSVVRDFDANAIKSGIDAVINCEVVIKQMSEALPDAKRYIAVYEALRGYMVRKFGRQLQSEGMPRPVRSDVPEILPLSDSHSMGMARELFSGLNSPRLDFTSNCLSDNHDALQFAHAAFQSESGLDDPSLVSNSAIGLPSDAAISEGSMLSWDIFGDGALWNMEAGLNEYACGDPLATLDFDEIFDLQNVL